MRLKVAIMNDAFPPTIDGTSSTTLNYANILHKNHCDVMVITPRAPHVKDNYPYEVFRYDAFQFNKKEQYQFGWPFRHSLREYVWSKNLDLMHFHCPIASGKFARIIAQGQKIPIVATYHTKYDYDIRKRVPTKALQDFFLRFIVTNMSAADEVWVVSPGAGENLKSIGYKGEYIVMPNGVDFPRGKADESKVQNLKKQLKIPDGVPIFLFVGRIMWYKNLKITVDALKILKDKGFDFRFVMVGKGTDERDIKRYINKSGIAEKCIYAGKISDREELRCYYSLADAFLFPSTFDSHGLVVREAAACECPSLLIRNSSAAYGIEEGVTGFLSEENAVDFAEAIEDMISDMDKLKQVGKNAGEKIYLSWTDSVAAAYERYENLCKNWPYPLPCKGGKAVPAETKQ